MSSEYEKKSMEELVQQARKDMQSAEKTMTYTTVTEANWSALLHLQQLQVQMLQMAKEQLNTLTTREQLTALQERQLEILWQETRQNAEDTERFRRELHQQETEFLSRTEQLTQTLSAQAGNISERFGSNLSGAEQKMKKFTVKTFWISLIPSAVMILSAAALWIFCLS